MSELSEMSETGLIGGPGFRLRRAEKRQSELSEIVPTADARRAIIRAWETGGSNKSGRRRAAPDQGPSVSRMTVATPVRWSMSTRVVSKPSASNQSHQGMLAR